MQFHLPGREMTGNIFDQSIRFLLCFLIVVILGGVLAGIVMTFMDVFQAMKGILLTKNTDHGLKSILIDALGVLALVEVYRTAMFYFIEGRVKVTHIIDTVLVAVLTETLAFWHRDVEENRILLLIALVFSLMIMRILAIRFSPDRKALCDGL
ncbi:MAG: phosphate-starvation-inducible PsiE family protein [Desulfuromonadales bacterium]|nr:phosphate-starvation-inducible PsiE family protein [Desulfuromonadales bacterium]